MSKYDPKEGKQRDTNRLNQPHGIGPDDALLSELPNVTFISSDVFLGTLARLEQVLPKLPIYLNRDKHYALAMKGNQIDLYAYEEGIEDFQMSPGIAVITRILRHSDGPTELHLNIDDEDITFNIHSDPFEDTPAGRSHSRSLHEDSAVHRTTSPWRSTPPSYSPPAGGEGHSATSGE